MFWRNNFKDHTPVQVYSSAFNYKKHITELTHNIKKQYILSKPTSFVIKYISLMYMKIVDVIKEAV